MSDYNKIIEEALDSVRPYLRTDGGDVELVEVTDDLKVKVRLLGACKTCTMSEMTMRAGIHEAIKKVMPNVLEIISVK